MTDEGQVRLQRRHPWRDGPTHVDFDPVDFLGRLAVDQPERAAWDDDGTTFVLCS